MPETGPRVARLEMVLADLGSSVEFPDTPDIAAGTAARLGSAAQPAARWLSPASWTRPSYAVAALAIALGLFFSFAPSARRAVAEWLGVAGVRIEVDTSATPRAPDGESELDLGERSTLEAATRLAPFEVKVPAARSFADPDAVFLERSGTGVRVSFLYEPGDGIPPSSLTGTGAILTQFDAEFVAGSIKKISGAGGKVRVAEVNGAPAYWIAGEPHKVGLTDAEGDLLTGTSRFAGNVLLWELERITFRLESELTFAAALEVARSTR
ncbi:MAG: hypothetical protein ACR2KQ_06470 [Actinomycetota bacterium]